MVTYVLAQDDVPARLGLGIDMLVPPLFDRDAGADFHPVIHAVDLVLEVRAGAGGDDAVEASLFQRAQYFVSVKAAVATRQAE